MLVRLPPLTEAVWLELPVMLMLPTPEGLAAIAAVATKDRAKNAIDFMMNLPAEVEITFGHYG